MSIFFCVLAVALCTPYTLPSLFTWLCVQGGRKEKWIGKYIDHLRIREALLVLCVVVVLVD